MQTLADLLIRINSTTKGLQQGLSRAEGQLKRSSRNIGKIADGINRSITLPFALAGAASVKMFADVEQSFAKIENLVGVTGSILDDFKSSVKDLSVTTGKSQADLAEALFVVTSAGKRGTEATRILEQAAKASAVGLGQTEAIARTVTSAMTAYGEAELSAAAAGDTLFKIVKEGNLEASSLSGTIGQLLPQASTLGIAFGDLGANIAVMTRLGLGAEETVTTLKSVMGALIKPSAQAAKALASVGLSSQKLREMVREKGLARTLVFLRKAFEGNDEALAKVIPNVRALTNVLGTTGAQAETYLQIAEDLVKTNGEVDKAFAKTAQTSRQKLAVAFVKIQNAGIELGATLAPVATKLADDVGRLASWFSNLDDQTKVNIVRFGLLASSMGLALKASSMMLATASTMLGAMRNMTRAVGIAATKWKALDTVMKTTVIGAVVAAIAGAVLVFHRLNKAMTGVTESQRNLNKVNQQALGDAQAQRAKIDSLISVYADEAEATDNRKAALSQLREVLGPHLKELDDQKIKLQDLKTAADNFTQSLIAQSKVTGITNLLSDANTELAELQKRLEMGQTIGGRAALGAQLIDEIFGTEQTERSVQKRINQLTKDIEHYQNQLTEAIQSQSALLTGAKPTGTPDLDLDLDTDQQPSSHPLVKTFDFIKFKTEGVKRDVRQIVDTITKKHETERGALAAISEQKAEEARQMKENIAGMAEAMNDFSQASDGLEMIREQMQAIDSFARSMGDAFIQTFEKIIQGGQKFGQFMKNMFLGIIKKALRALVITLALRAIGGGSLVGSFKEVFNTVAGLDKLFGFAGAKEVVPGAQRGAFIGGSGLVNLHPNEAVIPLSDPKAVNKIVSGLKRHGAGQATSPFKDGQILNVLRADMIFQLWKEGARQSGYMGGVGMQFNVS